MTAPSLFALSPMALMVLVCFIGLLAMAVVHDLRSYRIPNDIPLAILALFPAWAVQPEMTIAILPLALLTLGVLVVGLALFAGRFLGGGDIKLIVAVTPWVGLDGFPLFLIAMALAGAALAVFQNSGLRLGLAMAFGVAPGTGGALTGVQVPYAVAIAAGALAAVWVA